MQLHVSYHFQGGDREGFGEMILDLHSPLNAQAVSDIREEAKNRSRGRAKDWSPSIVIIAISRLD